MGTELESPEVFLRVQSHRDGLEGELIVLEASIRELQERALRKRSEVRKKEDLIGRLRKQREKFDNLMRLTDDEIRLMNLAYTRGTYVYSAVNVNPRGSLNLDKLEPQGDLGVLGERISAIVEYGLKIREIAFDVRVCYLLQESKTRSSEPEIPIDFDPQIKRDVLEVIKSPHFENVQDALSMLSRDLRRQVVTRTMPLGRADYLVLTPPENVYRVLVERTKRQQTNTPTWIGQQEAKVEAYNSCTRPFEEPAVIHRRNLKWIVGEIETEK